MEKLRGELWEGRAVDGKLKSSLEWPNQLQETTTAQIVAHIGSLRPWLGKHFIHFNFLESAPARADTCIMHLSICCPTLPLLGCIGDLPVDLTQDFPPGVGNLTVKSLMLPRGSIEMYTGFDTLARPL